jgi:Skp family chaperone for outer membrane proteins
MTDTEDRLITLLKECEFIEHQLGDKNRLNSDGSRMTRQQYHKWRKAATFALNKKRETYRDLKREQQEAARHADPDMAERIRHALEGGELDRLALLDELHDRFSGRYKENP